MNASKLRLFYIFLGVVYFLFPFDAFPDFIVRPLGYIDDILFAAYLYWRYKKFVGKSEAHNSTTAYGTLDDESEHSATEESSQEAFDPYEVLDLPRDCSSDDVERQYKQLVSKYHPDKVSHLGKELQALAHEKMIDIQRAYSLLSR